MNSFAFTFATRIDELGYLPVSRTEANFFFALISELYENTSIIITSNKGFDGWADVLGDPVLVTALLDRITHKCQVLSFIDNGDTCSECERSSHAAHANQSQQLAVCQQKAYFHLIPTRNIGYTIYERRVLSCQLLPRVANVNIVHMQLTPINSRNCALSKEERVGQ